MPMESTMARATREASDEARKRGHQLGAWGFHAGQAANRCERDGCDCRVLVTPGEPALGAAVALVCKEGGNAWIEAPQPAPSGPEHAHAETLNRCLSEGADGAERCAYEGTAPMPEPTREPEPVGASFGRKKRAA